MQIPGGRVDREELKYLGEEKAFKAAGMFARILLNKFPCPEIVAGLKQTGTWTGTVVIFLGVLLIACREVFEETGVRLTPARLKPIGT